MKNQLLNFAHNGVLLSFELQENGRIFLLYAGKERKYKKIPDDQKYFRVLVDVDMVEDTRNNHFGLKSVNSAYGITYKYVSHRESINSLGYEVVIVTRNEYLEVETHYQFYNDVSGLSSFNIVKNISNKNVTLTYVSSFVILGLWKTNTPGLSLYHSVNSWHCEAQWIKDSFNRLGLFTGNDWFSNKRYSINNTGSWSTKDHLPMMVIEDKKNKESTLVQIENNGSWHLELGDTFGYMYYLASGPEFNDNAWKKVLSPNETFTSCQATLTYGDSFEKVMQEITLIRRRYRRPNKDDVELPVIFNDYMHALWDTQTTELITPLVDIASEVGSDIFCMDAGWFALGNDWWKIVGEWKEYEPNFPNGGLRGVCDYIRSKGMKPGLWIEPEAVGVDSPIAKDFKDGSFFKANGANV
ncbi:MAG: alpha-galactosidase, partial [Bacilli bacterium]|nr:alpha-galactosidase [Bacilli bacterium]